jgi:hypothetical protein
MCLKLNDQTLPVPSSILEKIQTPKDLALSLRWNPYLQAISTGEWVVVLKINYYMEKV